MSSEEERRTTAQQNRIEDAEILRISLRDRKRDYEVRTEAGIDGWMDRNRKSIG